MLRFYYSPGASSFGAHVALHEVGAQFDARPVLHTRGDTHTPDYLRISPKGKVPVLVIDGKTLTENVAIMTYIGKKFPEAGLWPAGDLEAEAQAISWLAWISTTIHPLMPRVMAPNADPGQRDKAIHDGNDTFSIADRALGTKDWVFGRYSVVDIHLFRFYRRWSTGLRIGSGMFPNLANHHERMMMRPAVQRTLEVEKMALNALERA